MTDFILGMFAATFALSSASLASRGYVEAALLAGLLVGLAISISVYRSGEE